jgi:uncharacterized protein (DUF1778 family)
MTEKISVYVDKEQHRVLKIAAARQGITLSRLMLDAAMQSLHLSARKPARARMDQIREAQESYFSTEEILEMQNEGQRY